MIETIHGEKIESEKLEHIAPALRTLAVSVSELSLDPNNARKHEEKSAVAIARSLKKFGQQKPIVIDPGTNTIIAGNGTYEAATDVLRWEYIAAAPSNLSVTDQRAFAISDNRTAEKSVWDVSVLKDQIEELSDMGILDEIDIKELGFTDLDIKQIEREISAVEKDEKAEVGNVTEAATPATYKIMLICASESHKNDLHKALTTGNAKEISRLIKGCELQEK